MARLSGGGQRQAPGPPRSQWADDERLVLAACGAALAARAGRRGSHWAEAGMLCTMSRTRAQGASLAAKRAFLRPRAASMEVNSWVNSAAHRLGGFPLLRRSIRTGSVSAASLRRAWLQSFSRAGGSKWCSAQHAQPSTIARSQTRSSCFAAAAPANNGRERRWHANPAAFSTKTGRTQPHLHQERTRCALTDKPAAITRHQSLAEVSFEKKAGARPQRRVEISGSFESSHRRLLL